MDESLDDIQRRLDSMSALYQQAGQLHRIAVALAAIPPARALRDVLAELVQVEEALAEQIASLCNLSVRPRY